MTVSAPPSATALAALAALAAPAGPTTSPVPLAELAGLIGLAAGEWPSLQPLHAKSDRVARATAWRIIGRQQTLARLARLARRSGDRGDSGPEHEHVDRLLEHGPADTGEG